MDTITHGILGALVGKAFFADDSNVEAGLPRQDASSEAEPWRHKGAATSGNRLAIGTATLAAVTPDGDVFFGLFNSSDLAALELHRGFTHSFTCLPLFALGLAALVRWAAQRWNFPSPTLRTLTFISAASLASHILLDLITSYGTMIWSPLANVRAAWDLVFIIDFTFTAIVLLPQAAAWVYRRPRGSAARALALWVFFSLAAVGVEKLTRTVGMAFSPWVVVIAVALFGGLFFLPMRGSWGYAVPRARWCRAGVYALAGYLLLCAVAHRAALSRVQEFAASRGITVEHLGALPMPPSLLRWSGLIRANDGVYRAQFTLLDANAPEFAFTADAPANRYIEAVREIPAVRTYLWFARFPVVRYRERNGWHLVEFTDLRFTTGGIRRRAPFVFRVTLNSSGEVIAHGWAND